MDKGISHVLSMSILLYGLQRPIFNSQDKEPYSFVGLKAQEKTGLLLMPTAKVTKNVSAAEGGGNVLCSILISIKTKAWLYSFRHSSGRILGYALHFRNRISTPRQDVGTRSRTVDHHQLRSPVVLRLCHTLGKRVLHRQGHAASRRASGRRQPHRTPYRRCRHQSTIGSRQPSGHTVAYRILRTAQVHLLPYRASSPRSKLCQKIICKSFLDGLSIKKNKTSRHCPLCLSEQS